MNFPETDINQRGQNAAICGHILGDDIMEANGFRHREAFGRQFWSKFVLMAYKHLEMGFYVTIYDDDGSIEIDMLDEDFCQPYDWQGMDEDFDYAIKARDFSWDQMEKLVESGIVSGWKRGDYI